VPTTSTVGHASHSLPIKKGKKPARSVIKQPESYSINITKEALRVGKLPIETVAQNIAQNLY
jgi:serine/threonine protein kinase